jgi:heat shock protein HslJ
MAVALTGCGGGTQGGGGTQKAAALEGATWILDQTSTSNLGVPGVPADAQATIRFEGGKGGGKSFCNTYGGRYTATDAGLLRFGGFDATQMACADPLMALETAYLTALGKVNRFQVTGDRLVLSGSGPSLSFTKGASAQPLSLEGTAWKLDTIATGTQAVSSVIAGTSPFLTLDAGRASGSAGCNTFSGSYQLDGASLTFGPLATTQMACADDVMKQETAILQALGSVASWSIEGDHLTLMDAGGSLLLGYTGTPK